MQVKDDIELLWLMIADAKQVPDIYKTTNYWAIYEKKFLPELEQHGLHDFRQRKNSVLVSFGATDMQPLYVQINLLNKRLLYNKFTKKIPGWTKLLSLLNTWNRSFIDKYVPGKTNRLKQLIYDYVQQQGELCGAQPLNNLEPSLIGNPLDRIEANNKIYTTSILYYYMRYAYCCKYIDFNKVNIIVELGSGSGKQVEVIKKLHPHITFLLFDIAPQLYVCEQYLKAVFPEQVVSYRNTRKFDKLPSIEKGKIYILGNYKFPLLDEVNIDFFWNSASFQEMEPEVAANYLSFINKRAKSVYLAAVMSGTSILAKKKGEPGVLRPTQQKDYENGLQDFKLINIAPCMTPEGIRMWQYSDSFWEKKNI